ncbi:MAG: S-layer homology domain-containing protein, partial [Candidatus Peribacteraceae bacterium]|nr:S-layer homology domain-containing protein [Candidatus Peribacteraceae bacterium]
QWLLGHPLAHIHVGCRPVFLLFLLQFFFNNFLFFDEIAQLKEELQVWEEAHAEDFSGVIGQLDDITGPVYRDVGEKDWYASYVSSLTEWDIVSGFKDSDGKFTGQYKPGNNVTIAEVLKMSMRAAGVDETNCVTSPENVAATSHWAGKFVSCAEEMDVRLFRDPYLELNKHAKRAEMLTVIHDAFGDEVLPMYATFNDTSGHTYEADIAYATVFGIVSGDTNSNGVEVGTFRPDDYINRAETAKIIFHRMKEEVRKEVALSE